MNQLFLVEGTSTDTGLVLEEMITTISREKRERLLRYRHLSDRQNGVFAEVLLRCMISVRWDVPYSDIALQTGPYGKPFIANVPGCEFSLSHTNNALAVALSDKPVGVDVEKVRDMDMAISEKVFSEAEKTWLLETPEDQNRRFFELWTKKEALVKYIGCGISSKLKSFDVMGRTHEKITTFGVGGYIVSVCAAAEFRRENLIEISVPALIELWRHRRNAED